jgi:hypothetical protein
MSGVDIVSPLSVNAAAITAATDRLLLQREADLAKLFEVGQVLQLRVLSKLGPQRFSVFLAGGNRVMESSLPLQAGDVLHGRVAELGEQIVIERMRIEQAGGRPTGGTAASLLLGEALGQGRLTLQRPLSRSERDAIESSGKKTKDPALARDMGLALRNLGVELSPRAVAEAVELYKNHVPVEAVVGIDEGAADGGAVDLQEALKQLVESVPGDHGDLTDEDLFVRLVNAGDASCIRHRFNTVHVQHGERVIPLDIALFEQKTELRTPADETQYKAGVLNLATETLGEVTVQFLMRGDQLGISLSARRTATVNAFEDSATALSEAFRADGWVASVRCELSEETRPGAAAAVLAHLANLDRYETYA